jgi:uncharacterized Fe-S cluster-containing radical SAM superfamily protein
MYNPLELSKKTEKLVVKDNKKKYYRFRPTRFYGGIATADTVGCNLRCKFCWSGNSVWNSQKTGLFYSDEEVAEKLVNIAEAHGYYQVRISGGEPTIGRKHLLGVLNCIPSNLLFILETNGILLGADKSYIEELSVFKNLHIRVCFKGIDAEEFSLLTGAEQGYDSQLQSLLFLKDLRCNYNVALVSMKKDKQQFYDRIRELKMGNIMVEEEEIKLYPQVRNRLLKEDLLKYFE